MSWSLVYFEIHAYQGSMNRSGTRSKHMMVSRLLKTALQLPGNFVFNKLKYKIYYRLPTMLKSVLSEPMRRTPMSMVTSMELRVVVLETSMMDWAKFTSEFAIWAGNLNATSGMNSILTPT